MYTILFIMRKSEPEPSDFMRGTTGRPSGARTELARLSDVGCSGVPGCHKIPVQAVQLLNCNHIFLSTGSECSLLGKWRLTTDLSL